MITTLSGSNSYMVDVELHNLLNQYKESHGELAIEQIDGSDSEYQAIVESLSSLPFLTSRKLVILKSPSANKQFTEKIEDLLNNIPSTNEIVIVEPNLDKRSKYYKLLKDKTQYMGFEELDVNGLANWIARTVTSKGGKISSRDANYLVERVGINQLKVSNEIDKLISFNPEISRESIDKLVEPTPQSTIFQLLDAAFSGRRTDLIRIYDDQRQQKVEPQQIIAMLTWQLNGLALVKAAGDISPAEISKKTKLSPFVVNKNISIAKGLSFDDIKKLLDRLLDLDVKLKTRSVDPDDSLLQFLLSI